MCHDPHRAEERPQRQTRTNLPGSPNKHNTTHIVPTNLFHSDGERGLCGVWQRSKILKHHTYKCSEHTQACNTQAATTTAPCPCDANSYNHGDKTNCLSQYGASCVLEHNLTHRAMWAHGGQISAHNKPRTTTRIDITTCSHENGHTVSET